MGCLPRVQMTDVSVFIFSCFISFCYWPFSLHPIVPRQFWFPIISNKVNRTCDIRRGVTFWLIDLFLSLSHSGHLSAWWVSQFSEKFDLVSLFLFFFFPFSFPSFFVTVHHVSFSCEGKCAENTSGRFGMFWLTKHTSIALVDLTCGAVTDYL